MKPVAPAAWRLGVYVSMSLAWASACGSADEKKAERSEPSGGAADTGQGGNSRETTAGAFGVPLAVAGQQEVEGGAPGVGNSGGAAGIGGDAGAGGASSELRFDVVQNFSATTNPTPTGNFAYGWKPTLVGDFTLFNLPLILGDQLDGWRTSAGDSSRVVGFNPTSQNRIWGTASPGTFFTHPGPAKDLTVVRWTAPVRGAYRVSGAFVARDATTTTAYVLKNDSEPALYSGDVTSASAFEFDGVFSLEPGDTIDFEVDYGPNGNYLRGSTGLAATIEAR